MHDIFIKLFKKIVFLKKGKKTLQVYALLGRNTVVLTQVVAY